MNVEPGLGQVLLARTGPEPQIGGTVLLVAALLTAGVGGIAVWLGVALGPYFINGPLLGSQISGGLLMSGLLAGAVYAGAEAIRLIASPQRTWIVGDAATRSREFGVHFGVAPIAFGGVASIAFGF